VVATTDEPVTAPLGTSGKMVMLVADKPATMTAPPTAPEVPRAPRDPETARLMARASVLVAHKAM
jgi:hypothetical protein